MNEENNKQEISVETPIGKLAAKGMRISDLIAIVAVIGIATILYFNLRVFDLSIEHQIDTKNAMSAVAVSIKDSAKAQRLMTCIISLPQERREQEFTQSNSFCQRMANLP